MTKPTETEELTVIDFTGILLGNTDLVCERGDGPDNDLSLDCTLPIYPAPQVGK